MIESVFWYFALFILLIWFLSTFLKPYREQKHFKDRKKHRDLVMHTVRHGHRCYIEGLSDAERRIVALLAQHLSHKDYFIFNNIIIPSSHNGSAQIDHIVVSKFGVFVIESKEYAGWIFAHAERDKWTVTYQNGEKHQIHSPLFQNFSQVSALKEQIGFLGGRVYGAVVFSGVCEFKTPKPNGVFYEDELVSFIKSKQKEVLKEVELLVVIGKLSLLCQTVDITPDEHIANVENVIARKCEA